MAAHRTPQWLTSVAADLDDLLAEHTLLVVGTTSLAILASGYLLGRWSVSASPPIPRTTNTRDATTQLDSPSSTVALIPERAPTKNAQTQITSLPCPCKETYAAACLGLARMELDMRPHTSPDDSSSPMKSQLENKDFIALKNKTEAILGNLKRLDQNIHKVMDTGIYCDLRLNEISDVLDSCLVRIIEEQDQHPRFYLPGAKPHKEVSLPDPEIVMVDTYFDLHDMLETLGQEIDRLRAAEIAIDLEGYHLGREGTISLIQIYVPCFEQVYLVDVTKLGAKLFTAKGTFSAWEGVGQVTLKQILQNKNVKKFFWDCRADSQALFALYGVKLARVVDVQLWDVATRGKQKDRRTVKKLMHALPERMRGALTESSLKSWKLVKQAGAMTHERGDYAAAEEWFLNAGGVLPEDQGSSNRNSQPVPPRQTAVIDFAVPLAVRKDVFAQRPLRPLLQLYAVNDVRALPLMVEQFTTMHRFWSKEWEERVLAESAKRVEEGKSLEYQTANAGSKSKNLAPEGWVDVVQVDRFAE